MPILKLSFRSTAELENENPVLPRNELVVEALAIDADGSMDFDYDPAENKVTAKFKNGDGLTNWSDLEDGGVLQIITGDEGGGNGGEGAPEASQAEVDAGAVAGKYVSPKTLAGRRPAGVGYRGMVELAALTDTESTGKAETPAGAQAKAGAARAAAITEAGTLADAAEAAAIAEAEALAAAARASAITEAGTLADAAEAAAIAEAEALAAAARAAAIAEAGTLADAAEAAALTQVAAAGYQNQAQVNALIAAAEDFVTVSEAVDADDYFNGPARLLITNESSLNFPADGRPVFFAVAGDADLVNLTQIAWGPDTPLFFRTGTVDRTDPEDPAATWTEWRETGGGSGTGGGVDLSFEEQWTGRRDRRDLDNPRKIYVKTIDLNGFVPGIETVDVPHGISGIYEILKCEGTIYSATRSQFLDIPRVSSNGVLFMQNYKTYIRFISTINFKQGYPLGFLTIEYTKEAD